MSTATAAALVEGQPVTLPAGDAVVTPITLNLAARWLCVVHNTGDEDVTACRLRRYPIARGEPGPWRTISTGLPVATGETLEIDGADDTSETMDVELTSADGTTVALWLAGAR